MDLTVTTINRDRSPVAVLLDPKADIPIGERDIRLEDYLNDKIQTSSDFGNLETLVGNVELQKVQLDEQVKDAKIKLAEARQAAADHGSTMAKQIEAFEEQQDSLRERMLMLSHANTPEEAVRRLKRPMEKLRQVELAEAYVQLLNDINNMTRDAQEHLPHDPKAALEPYVRLRQLAIALRAAQDPAEGAAVHLVSYVEQTSTQLWAQMVSILTKEFNGILAELKWPDFKVEPNRAWSDCFTKLLELQAPEIKDAEGPLVLLPFIEMIKPLEKNFRFHFMGTMPTSASASLGEYFLPWFIGIIDRYEPYLRENVGPVMTAHFMGTPLAGNSLYVDPVSAFINALLPLAKDKAFTVVNEIRQEPSSMSRFVSELIAWDDVVRTKYAYDGGNAEFGWKGLTWDVLDVWFDRWLDVEEAFAIKRYEEIVQEPDCGLIDYDSNEPKKTKATFGATKIADILKNNTTLYKGLRRFSHRVRFFLHTQTNILDRYQIRLSDSLEAYISLTSTVSGVFQGYTREEQMSVEGMAGLVSLSKVFCSANHIISTLRELINEDFFIQLYADIDERAAVVDPEGSLAGPESYSQVKLSTSLKLGTGHGSVFDAAIDSFREIRKGAETLLNKALTSSIPPIFRPYLTKAQWTTVGDEPLTMALPDLTGTISAELDQPLQLIKEDMEFFHKTLSYAAFMRIWRQTITTVEDLLFNEVLLKQEFTTLGAARFAQDLAGIKTVFGIYVDVDMEGQTSFIMVKLTQGIGLLNLPLKPSDGISLSEAAESIFASKNDCETTLRTLGFHRLGNNHARQIMQRRVEAND